MKEGYTAREIAEVFGVTKMAVIKRANKETWPFQEVPNSRGGGRQRLYLTSGLPIEVLEKVRRWEMGLDEASVEELVARFELKVPPEKLQDPTAAVKVRMTAECLALPRGCRSRRRRIAEIAHSHGFSPATAYRLLKRAEEGKPLFGKRRSPGVRLAGLGVVVRAWDERGARAAAELILSNRQGRVEGKRLYEELLRQAEKEGFRVGSYRSFMDLACRIRPELIRLRDLGIRGLREEILPPIRRDPTAYRAMECLVGDQHKADYYAIDRDGNIATLELYAFMDFRSQLIFHSLAYKHYNRYTVGQALVNAVRFGLPAMIYMDWGMPERSKYLEILIEQLTGLGVRIEPVRTQRATPRHPQAKPLEGWFSWLDRKLRNERLPGWCRRLSDARANELQQKEIKAQIKAGELLSVAELSAEIGRTIEAWNRHTFKNRGEDTGKSPIEIYIEESRAHPVATLSEELLDYIFLPVRHCTVRQSLVRFKTDYFSIRAYHAKELRSLNGLKLPVRYDPYDPAEVWVIHGKEAIRASEWGEVNPKMRDEVSARIAIQRELAAEIRQVYRSYVPPGRTVRRMNPHEGEARAVRRARDIRILRTPLDGEDEETGAAAIEMNTARRLFGMSKAASACSAEEEEGPGLRAARRMFGMEASAGQGAPPERVVPFRLTIDDPYPDEED